ncbi:MAG: protein translocase subunit SecF [Deltaproteobacteria bacterium]|nr:protein translocase subunit SecF [Deltaproteobacteria bacterium]RLA91119.1 MAG: protein translocase subunit SecF [Deltaproteobacteria bacterium]
MEFVRPDININFVGRRRYAYIFSALLILFGIFSIFFHHGLNLGIDFAGGTLVQVKFTHPVNVKDIKESLANIGLGNAIIQGFGAKQNNEFLLRMEKSVSALEGLSGKIKKALEDHFGKGTAKIMRVEMVGPKVGKDLKRKGALAILYSLIGLLIYITIRFEFRFATGAIVALAHDVLITIGAFSITNKEFNLPIVAALLTIVGYSLNDTIVVYDRIRENMKKTRSKDLEEVINKSINQTLSRTILTSLTTLLVVLIIFIFGGGVIHDFAFALLVGVIIGTYSSIFVASPIVLIWKKRIK